MNRQFIILLSVVLVVVLIGSTALAAGNSRRAAVLSGADRVVELQRTDTGWEGTWYWYVGSTYNATNLTGVTALGLLEAYKDTKDEAYLNAAISAADFIMTHLGVGATGTPHYPRLTAPDVVFLYLLSEVTDDPQYETRANLEWENLKVSYPTAATLDTLFRTINRPSTWDIAFFMEAAYLYGDNTWADDAAAILADTEDTFYYGETWWYALNIAGSVRALVGCGYAGQYYGDFVTLLTNLIGVIGEDGVDGWVQDTAYAVLALNSVGGAAKKYANDLGRWLANQQQENGGWLEAGYEYPEVNGEAVRALASTIGTNVTLDGFESGAMKSSSWIRVVNGNAAIPFNGD
jgi:hypothetical protein